MYLDGYVVSNKIRGTDGNHGVAMTCIGGGYYRCDSNQDSDVISSFKNAGHLFKGKIGGVVAYDSPISDISEISRVLTEWNGSTNGDAIAHRLKLAPWY